MRRFAPLAAASLAFFACQRGGDAVLAKVGKSKITESEFRRKLEEVAPDYQNYVLTPYGQRQFLDVLIRERLILEAARAAGAERLPAYRDKVEQLEREERERAAEAKQYWLTRSWLDQLRQEGVLKVTDEEVRGYHAKHSREVLVRHILLAGAEDAEAVLREVRGKTKFAAVAQKSSLDADTAANGGRMRPALFGEIIPELEVVFTMRTGEVGGPVRSKFGYHVLLKEGDRPVPLASAQERIRNILEKQKLDAHLQSLQAAYPVEVLDAQFK